MDQLIERWIRFACVIAGADYELLRDSSRIDRMTVAGNAVQLLLVGTLAVLAWSVFFASFLPLHRAVPIGCLIGTIVFMLDRAMCVSDWSLTGVLRSGRPSLGFCVKVAGRVAVAMLLAIATAWGAVLALCAGAIDQHMRLERQTRNQPLLDEFGAAKQEVRERLTGPLASELEVLKAERVRLQRAIDEREVSLSEARQRASEARVEAGRERDGGLKGYVRGAGPRYRDAVRLEREAQLVAQQSAQDTARLQRRFDELGQVIASKSVELRAAVAAATAEEARIELRMQQDSRWSPDRNDPLSRAMALEAMQREPAMGRMVEKFELQAKVTLITLELAFLLIKLMSPASLYMVRLIRRTKEEAAREAHEYQEYLRGLRRQAATSATQMPRMRLLGMAQPAVGGSN